MEAVVLEDEVLQILIVGDGNERVEVPGRTHRPHAAGCRPSPSASPSAGGREKEKRRGVAASGERGDGGTPARGRLKR